MRCEWLQAFGKCGDTSLVAVGDELAASVEPVFVLVAAGAGVVVVVGATRTSAGDST